MSIEVVVQMEVYLEYMGYCVVLPEGDTVIGRDVRCALRFNDPAISRKHLQLSRTGDTVYARDLGSSNGTLRNGVSLDGTAQLASGDVLDIGAYRLTLLAMDDETSESTTLKLMPLAQIGDLGHPRFPQASSRPTLSRATAPTDPPLDRRIHERVPLELRVVYASSELEIETTTRNISVSGVFVNSLVLDPIGTTCDLSLLIDGGPSMTVRGVVRRVVQHEPVGLGIEFVGLGIAERTWLEIVVARLESASAPNANARSGPSRGASP